MENKSGFSSTAGIRFSGPSIARHSYKRLFYYDRARSLHFANGVSWKFPMTIEAAFRNNVVQ